MKKSGKGKGADREAARQRVVRRAALLVTVGVVVVGLVVVLVVTLRPTAAPTQDPALPRQPAVSAADLESAADAAGFRPTTASDVGIVENLPADTTLLAPSRSILPVGVPAPDFTLSTPQGETVRLSDYRGKTVLLEFFASWCPHCQAEAPHLVRLHGNLPTKDYTFLSVNADSEDAGSIHAFERWFRIPWPALLDVGSPTGSFRQAGGAGPVTASYGVGLYPTFFVIDPRGRIAWRNDREQPDALLLQQLQDAARR